MPPKSKGRMIRKGISQSKRIASLSIESGFLFCLLIPHFSAHGKMNGSPYYIKGEVVPLINHYTLKRIEKCLKEISDKTNVKWFWSGGLQHLHSLKWTQHQELRAGRLGSDYDPSFPGELPELTGVVPPEVEGKEEGKGKEEVEDKVPEADIYFLIIEDLNLKVNGSFKHKTEDTQKHINARLNEGHTVEDFFIVNEYKAADWMNTEQAKYLRPSTLYIAKNFEGYLTAGNRWVLEGMPGKGQSKPDKDPGDDVPF